jgi:hypothetical protein
MSIDFRAKNSAIHDHLLKQTELVANASITFNAVPASKAHASDVPGGIYLRTQGKTAEADAVEDISALVTAPVDSTGKFGILIDDPTVEKLYLTSVTPSSGTVSVVASGVTPGGRLYLDLDSSLDLSAASLTVTLELNYKKKK